ncbi:LysR family transcriptional regulator [Clostridium sp. 19966]|nr:LysR family transcriptional regulator [Clostridium sp. 19966]MDT8716728.1 LysR family transcriptional regulator [Clostridium sp. 19966]
MNLRDLEYFSYLCKTKNFTKAAEMLYVSQPSVTMAIKGKRNKRINCK